MYFGDEQERVTVVTAFAVRWRCGGDQRSYCEVKVFSFQTSPGPPGEGTCSFCPPGQNEDEAAICSPDSQIVIQHM